MVSLVLKRVGSVEHGGREQIECVVEIQFTRVARDEQSIRERHGQRDELIDLGRPQRREGTPIEACDVATVELCAALQVGESTVHAKARAIENALGVESFDPRWTLPSMAENNPLVWIMEVNGLLVDLRGMSREVQEIAFENGLIPFIPADRQRRS